MTLSLAAVFIPVLFMGGILGRLLHEFAVTIIVGDADLRLRLADADADAVQPHRCKPHEHEQRHGRVYMAFERGFDAWRDALRAHAALGARGTSASRCSCSSPSASPPAVLFARMPKGFLPSEDTGQLFAFTEGAAGHLLRGDGRAAAPGGRRSCAHDPDVEAMMSFVGAERHRARRSNIGPHLHRAQAARQAQARRRGHAASCGPSSPTFPASRSSCRTCRRSASAAAHQEPVPVHAAGRRTPSELYRLGAAASRRSCATLPGFHGRHQRPADHQSAGQRRDRPRQGLRAGRHRRSRSRTRSTTPTAAPGLDHLHRRPTSTG